MTFDTRDHVTCSYRAAAFWLAAASCGLAASCSDQPRASVTSVTAGGGATLPAAGSQAGAEATGQGGAAGVGLANSQTPRAGQQAGQTVQPPLSGAPADAGVLVDAAAADSGGPATLQAPLEPGDPGSADVQVEIRSDGTLRPISPLIYGTNGAPEIARTQQSVVRSGGNRMTAYNWENNASNAGSDYQFQNDDFLSASDEPARLILDGLQEAAQAHAAAVVTVPIVDYVSADKNAGGDVRNSGANYLSTRFKQNKADSPSAPPAATPDTTDGFVYQDQFVAYLKSRAPAGTTVLFSLDNEPDLWSHTHAEVHPEPVTYAELWERNLRYATAIKRVWPEAPVLGLVSYGWNGYLTLQDASDGMKRDFIDWYLDRAKAAHDSSGLRTIDYLDLHWYPEAQGGGVRVTENNTGADVVAAREQAPRSLWDTTYQEKSWIKDNLKEPIQLIPRIRSKIDQHYPGSKLAISEWNYGGGNHISGAIACADVLGIFGREGVDLANYWPFSSGESFAYAAFRAYRNYDGAGAKFGDRALSATTSDVEQLTVYASLHADATERVVIVLINKAQADRSVALRLAHPRQFVGMSVYQLAGAAAEWTKQAEQTAAASNAWKLTVPAQSVSVLVPVPGQ